MAKYTLSFSKPVKSDHNYYFWYFQNNRNETTKFFSVRSNPDLPMLKKCSPIQSWSGQNWLQSWSSPDPCSSLVSTLLSQWTPTAIVICKYLAFKGPTTATLMCKQSLLSEGPQQQMQYASTFLPKGPHHHLQWANKKCFKPTSIPKMLWVKISSKKLWKDPIE